MHEMQTIFTNVHAVCLSVCLSRGSASMCGAFGAAFAKSLWRLVIHLLRFGGILYLAETCFEGGQRP